MSKSYVSQSYVSKSYISKSYISKSGVDRQGVTEIKDFVKKLKEMNLDRKKLLIGMHTNLAVEIGSQMKADAFKDKYQTPKSPNPYAACHCETGSQPQKPGCSALC